MFYFVFTIMTEKKQNLPIFFEIYIFVVKVPGIVSKGVAARIEAHSKMVSGKEALRSSSN